MATIADSKRLVFQMLGYLGSNQDMENQFWLNYPSIPSGLVLKSQIYTANATLTTLSPYRSIGNNASGITITLPVSPASDETRVVTNVGAGAVTASYTGRAGATTKTIAQDNAQTFAYNSTLGYWTLE